MQGLVHDRCLTSQGDMIDLLVRNQGVRIQTVNLDHLRLAAENADFRAALESADYHTADGWPVLRWLRKHRPEAERVTGSQFVADLTQSAALDGRRWALYGGHRETAEAFERMLSDAGQSLAYARTDRYSDWDAEIEARLCEREGVHHVLIAISQPAGEIFAARLHAVSEGLDIVGVGGGVEMAVGQQARAPQLVQLLHIEWLYRLARNPRRLFRRYVLHDIPFFLQRVLPALLRRHEG